MPSTAPPPAKRARTSSSMSSSSIRQFTSLIKTEITINIYDLLPPGRLSSLLWTVGSSLLHSGVVIRDREYAYGGHSQRNTTGVYWTRPKFEPPGGTLRGSILQGFTYVHSETELDEIIRQVSEEFLGTDYNLLTHNCNHFTSVLCERLLGKAGAAPAWLNRAASVGLALPCMVPREWIAPPDFETAEGELVDGEEEEEDEDEEAAMLKSDRRRRQRDELEKNKRQRQAGSGSSGSVGKEDDELGGSLAGGRRIFDVESTPPPRLVKVKDSSGRGLPAAERAPMPKRMSREL